MGECSFWYRPTRVVPDQRPLNGRCCCCCSAITTLAHHWVHKPVNITRPLKECSAVKRIVNHWMHKPVNIIRRLNSCAICMPKNAYSIFCSKAYNQLLFFCFNTLLYSLHNHSSVFWRSSTTFRLVNTTEPVKMPETGMKNIY